MQFSFVSTFSVEIQFLRAGKLVKVFAQGQSEKLVHRQERLRCMETLGWHVQRLGNFRVIVVIDGRAAMLWPVRLTKSHRNMIIPVYFDNPIWDRPHRRDMLSMTSFRDESLGQLSAEGEFELVEIMMNYLYSLSEQRNPALPDLQSLAAPPPAQSA